MEADDWQWQQGNRIIWDSNMSGFPDPMPVPVYHARVDALSLNADMNDLWHGRQWGKQMVKNLRIPDGAEHVHPHQLAMLHMYELWVMETQGVEWLTPDRMGLPTDGTWWISPDGLVNHMVHEHDRFDDVTPILQQAGFTMGRIWKVEEDGLPYRWMLVDATIGELID